MGDRSVPFATGAIPSDYRDPFAKAERIARSLAPDPNIEHVSLEAGGLFLEFHKDCQYIIKSMSKTKIPRLDPVEMHKSSRRSWRVPILPFFLRPSTFAAAPYGLGYILPFLMPVLLPSFLVYLITRFLIQSRYSRQRIRAMVSKGDLSTLEGQLRRVGLALEDTFEEIAEVAFPADGDIGGDLGPDLADAAATDALLTPAQKRMTDNFNSIPGLRKHLVYLPMERNSHATIICRDIRRDAHQKGLEILNWWSARFVF